jgi:hypothetical protein
VPESPYVAEFLDKYGVQLNISPLWRYILRLYFQAINPTKSETLSRHGSDVAFWLVMKSEFLPVLHASCRLKRH